MDRMKNGSSPQSPSQGTTSNSSRNKVSSIILPTVLITLFSLYITILNQHTIVSTDFINNKHNNDENDYIETIIHDDTFISTSNANSGEGGRSSSFLNELGSMVQNVMFSSHNNNNDASNNPMITDENEQPGYDTKQTYDNDQENYNNGNNNDNDDDELKEEESKQKYQQQKFTEDIQERINSNVSDNDDFFASTTENEIPKQLQIMYERQQKEDINNTKLHYKPDDEEEKDDTNHDNSKDPTNNNKPLNILLFYPDDWRYDTIGSEKSYIITPFLDSLAKQGIRFTQNAVTTSVCWMSRATLFMGQYSSRHKSYKLMCPRFGSKSNWEHSYVKLLQRRGYFVGHIGKWQYFTRNTKKYFDWARLFEGSHWERLYGGRTLHASDLTSEYGMQFFKDRPKDKPFALSVAFFPPKAVGSGKKPGEQFSPTNETKALYENVTIPEPEMVHSFQALPEFLRKSSAATGRFVQRYKTSEHYQASMKNYYALVSGVDKACKEIVDKLKEEGLYNNTMIIFTTDNGMFHGSHGLAGKWYPYQESIRVPLIIYDPRMPLEKRGTLDDSLTLNIDLAETILGAAGVKPSVMMQGRDISDIYLSDNEKNDYHDTASVVKDPWRDEFFYEFPSFDEKFIASSTALVRKDWKYIHWTVYDREQLFHLKIDPMELNDLYNRTDAKPVLDRMRRRHDKYKENIFDTSYANDTGPCKQFQADLFPPNS